MNKWTLPLTTTPPPPPKKKETKGTLLVAWKETLDASEDGFPVLDTIFLKMNHFLDVQKKRTSAEISPRAEYLPGSFRFLLPKMCNFNKSCQKKTGCLDKQPFLPCKESRPFPKLTTKASEDWCFWKRIWSGFQTWDLAYFSGVYLLLVLVGQPPPT